MKILGTVYNSEDWEKFKENTTLFKLTWKINFQKVIDDKNTYWGKMLGGELC